MKVSDYVNHLNVHLYTNARLIHFYLSSCGQPLACLNMKKSIFGELIEIVERNSNSAYDCCVYVLIYALKKGMDSSLHPLSNGQIVGYIAPFGVGVHPV